MSNRKCTCCGEEKPIESFRFKNTKKGEAFGRVLLCSPCEKERTAKWYVKHREKHLARAKAYQSERYRTPEHQEYIKAYRKRYYEENKEELKKQRNKERGNALKRKEHHRRYGKDELFTIKYRLRNRTRLFIKARGYKRRSKTQDVLGADWDTVKAHLESTFTDGMTWESVKEWHIDHIIPLDSAKTEEEMVKLCHYTNLQALWASDNLKKGNRIV